MPIHGMIDLETLDVTPQATVLTVGGVKFNPFDDSEPHSEFYYKLDLDSQDRSVNDDTIAWWGTQDQKVQDEAFGTEGRVHIDEFLNSTLDIIFYFGAAGDQFFRRVQSSNCFDRFHNRWID